MGYHRDILVENILVEWSQKLNGHIFIGRFIYLSKSLNDQKKQQIIFYNNNIMKTITIQVYTWLNFIIIIIIIRQIKTNPDLNSNLFEVFIIK